MCGTWLVFRWPQCGSKFSLVTQTHSSFRYLGLDDETNPSQALVGFFTPPFDLFRLKVSLIRFPGSQQTRRPGSSSSVRAMAQVNTCMAAWACQTWPDGCFTTQALCSDNCMLMQSTLYIFTQPMSCCKRSRYSNRAVTTLTEQSYLVMCDPVLVIIIIIIDNHPCLSTIYTLLLHCFEICLTLKPA